MLRKFSGSLRTFAIGNPFAVQTLYTTPRIALAMFIVTFAQVVSALWGSNTKGHMQTYKYHSFQNHYILNLKTKNFMQLYLPKILETS